MTIAAAGVVVKPVGDFKTAGAYQYTTIRTNVDMLKMIQLGLTFCNAQGELPKHNGELCVWQFNFREFDLDTDLYAPESIKLLIDSGINFRANVERGVDQVCSAPLLAYRRCRAPFPSQARMCHNASACVGVAHTRLRCAAGAQVHTCCAVVGAHPGKRARAQVRFAELLLTSGVVLNADVSWITFHAGYDFGCAALRLCTAPAAWRTSCPMLPNVRRPHCVQCTRVVQRSPTPNRSAGATPRILTRAAASLGTQQYELCGSELVIGAAAARAGTC